MSNYLTKDMEGNNNQDGEEEQRANEPAAIRQMNKSQLYNLLSEQWYLPTKDSKGVNRGYLVRVYMDEVCRIPSLEFRLFIAARTPGELKKSSFLSLSELFIKLNALLNQMGHHPLGFREGVIPEEKWMMGVARYIDRTNLSGAFLRALAPIEQMNNIHSQIVKNAQTNANQWLFRQVPQQNTKILAQKVDVKEAYKKTVCTNRDIIDLERVVVNLRAKRNEENTVLRAKIMVMAGSIFNLARVAAGHHADDLIPEDGAVRNDLQLVAES